MAQPYRRPMFRIGKTRTDSPSVIASTIRVWCHSAVNRALTNPACLLEFTGALAWTISNNSSSWRPMGLQFQKFDWGTAVPHVDQGGVWREKTTGGQSGRVAVVNSKTTWSRWSNRKEKRINSNLSTKTSGPRRVQCSNMPPTRFKSQFVNH